jgi:hypothetical protein
MRTLRRQPDAALRRKPAVIDLDGRLSTSGRTVSKSLRHQTVIEPLYSQRCTGYAATSRNRRVNCFGSMFPAR